MSIESIFAEYGWLIAGAVLLGLEAILPGVFLLFFGIAAVIVGFNVLFLGSDGFFGFGQQIVAFIVLTGVGVLVGRHWYGAKDEPAGGNVLNRRGESLVGRQGPLAEAIVNGRGRMAVDDGWWTVEGKDLPSGARVRVTGSKGNILHVEEAADPVVVDDTIKPFHPTQS